MENLYPRCVTREGNLAAQEQLWKVFRPLGGRWRGIAHVPNGNLRLRDEWAQLDARRRFDIDLKALWDFAPPALVQQCICGEIMSGRSRRLPAGCSARSASRRRRSGACMVSSEGTCRIRHQYGGAAASSARACRVEAPR